MNKRSMEGMLGQDIETAAQAFRDVADDLNTPLNGKARDIAGQAQSAYDQVKDQAAATFAGIDAFVSERPYLSVAMAVIAGTALGFVYGLGRPRAIVIRQSPAPRSP